MNSTIYFILLVFLCFWEVRMIYDLVEKIYHTDGGKKYKIIKYGNIFSLGILLAINRMLAFSSRVMVVFSILITAVCISQIIRGKKGMVFGIAGFYYIFLTLLDFIFAYICIEFIGAKFEKIIYVAEYSVWTVGIYIVARSLMWGLLSRLKKVTSQEVYLFLSNYQKLLLAGSIFLFVIMSRYQFVLNSMVLGEREIQGVDKAILLSVGLAMLILVVCLYFQYDLKKKETEFLRFRDQMLEERCQEMQQTRQIAHDMRNHIIVLKKYDDKGQGEKLHQYIQALYQELTICDIQVWTGIETLDYLLTQKMKRAEQKRIEFKIETQRICSVPFSDLEIVSVFGNLLDNAIEACEKMGMEGRWIHLLIKKKNHMFFVEVANSIGKETNKRNEKNVGKGQKGGLQGYGLKNVQQIVERHKGETNCQSVRGVYSVTISVYSKGGV